LKSIVWFGAILAVLGIIGLALPDFTTSQSKEVAKVGDLKLQSTELTTHTIPESLSLGAIGLGLVLIAAGTFVKR
jgi:drug/metabolite transporter (DMT)-like permease